MSTMINWFWAYLTFGGGIRLITGAEGQETRHLGSRVEMQAVSLRNPS
jgi:hypothetical protein